MTSIAYYNNLNVRYFALNGQLWFRGNDVAAILGYCRPRNAIADHVDAEDRFPLESLDVGIFAGNEGRTWYINESGLYSLILRSKQSEAKLFKRWVTSELLPKVRTHHDVLQKIQESADAGVRDKDKDGYVYAATSSRVNYVKLGRSRATPAEILARYKTYYGPDTIIETKAVYDMNEGESKMHLRFSNHCLGGELFDKKFRNEYIEAMQSM